MESQFRWYLAANAAWFASYGVQMTLFPWLVAVALREPASRVGIAWTAMMAPAIVFMLLGGAVADRADGRRLLIYYHLLAAGPPLALAGVAATGGLIVSRAPGLCAGGGDDRRVCDARRATRC